MLFTDRLYGTLELPPLVTDMALACPLILRLREIRMPNIPFATFPSFANTSRYEHSLGVAHLAWRWARKQPLSIDSGTALALAGLYHDAATPAFSHLYEEFLGQYGFEHESALNKLITGRGQIPGATQAQVFLGRSPLIADRLPYRNGDSLLSRKGVASLVSGEGVLGRVIAGDLDLDNIDNVVRATTAMGLGGSRVPHPYSVAEALTFDGTTVRLNANATQAILEWRALRRTLYQAILGSELEFRAQTAIRWAIEECAVVDQALTSPSAWTLTEPELVYDHLRRPPLSRYLVDRVRLGRPPSLLFSMWTQDLSQVLSVDGGGAIRRLSQRLNDLTGAMTYVNFYVDKRERAIRLPPPAQPSLFDDLQGMPAEGAVSTGDKGREAGGTVGMQGVLGAVYVTRSAVSEHNGVGNTKAFHRPTTDQLVDAVREDLSIKSEELSFGWLGGMASRT